MNAIHPTFGSARVRVMHISYRCDVTKPSASVVPLGVMTDLRISSFYGLGLRARTALSADELNLIGGIMRPSIANPFQMLKKIFDTLWHDSDRDAFLDLPERYMGALRFEKHNHNAIKFPHSLATQDFSVTVGDTKQWIKDKLSAAGQDQYWKLLETYQPKSFEAQDENKIAA
jgi:hypothetical protein